MFFLLLRADITIVWLFGARAFLARPHSCAGRVGKSSTVHPGSWRLTECARSGERRGFVSLLAEQFKGCKRKGNSSVASLFLCAISCSACNSHPHQTPWTNALSLKLYVPPHPLHLSKRPAAGPKEEAQEQEANVGLHLPFALSKLDQRYYRFTLSFSTLYTQHHSIFSRWQSPLLQESISSCSLD